MEKKSPTTFSDLISDPDLLKAIDELGFTTPTEIQEKAIPMLLNSDLDFVGQAQTGTGKTAAFALPILSELDTSSNAVQVLILSPTRELAQQIHREIQKLTLFKKVKSTCIFGGENYTRQIASLKKDKPQIVIGTPGRVLDHIRRKTLILKEARQCVLDEADEMLNMGFYEDVQTILGSFSSEKQLIMFSATMPKSILNLIGKNKREYNLIKVEKKTLSNDDIEQKYFIIRDKHFKESLCRIIESCDDIYAIVFCRTRIETNEVGDHLKGKGYNIGVLNGDMGQAERNRSLANFSSKKTNILICTDVAARGIDVVGLTHVINFGLPQDNESYVHRIGRTGRAGMKGKAYTIVGPNSAYVIKKISRHINKDIQLAKLPTIEILKTRLLEKEIEKAKSVAEKIVAKEDDFKIDSTFELFKDNFSHLNEDQLLKLIFTLKFNDAYRNYSKLSDIETEAQANSRGENSRRRPRGRGGRRGKEFGSGSGTGSKYKKKTSHRGQSKKRKPRK